MTGQSSNLTQMARLVKGCLLVILFSLALVVKAQPDLEGHPDSYKFYLIPPDTDDWTRHFHIGGFAAFNISGSFKMNGDFNVSGNDVAKGIFDDGYVRPDKTGSGDGLTSFWGYNNQSQVSGEDLIMHATTGYSTLGSEHANADAGPSPGFDMAYGANYWYWKHARVGWELGFDLLPTSIKDSHRIAVTANQSTYTFHTGNAFLPPAPYQGGDSGSGILIQNNSFTNSSSSSSASVTGSRSLDAIIYSVRLGPTFDWDLGSHVDMQLGAGPVLGVVDGEYSFDETITISPNNQSPDGGVVAHNRGSFSSVGVQYGGYANATFNVHLTQSADFYLGAQYMTMSDYSISSQGRSAKLDLGGQIYISAGINWPF